jgi:hypothetical protein
MVNKKIYEYVLKPYLFFNVSSSFFRDIMFNFKIMNVYFYENNNEYDIEGNYLLGIVIEKNESQAFDDLIDHVNKNYNAVDYYQLNNINSKQVMILFRISDDIYTNFIEGKYSKLWPQDKIQNKTLASFYTNEKVDDLEYNKYYYSLTHSKEYFDRFFKKYIGFNDLEETDINYKNILTYEYDSKLSRDERENHLFIEKLQKSNKENV